MPSRVDTTERVHADNLPEVQQPVLESAKKERKRAYNAAYQQAHLAGKIAYDAVYYQAHRDECKAQVAAYRKTHRAEIVLYRQANHARMALYDAAYDTYQKGSHAPTTA